MIGRLVQLALAIGLAVGGFFALEAYGDEALAAVARAGYVLEWPELIVGLWAIPALLAMRAFTLSDLPRVQHALSFALKSAFVAALTVSLMNPQTLEREPRRAAVVFVVDVSESVPEAALARAQTAVEAAWREADEETVRLVTFAAEAREVPLPARAPGGAAGAERSAAGARLPPIARFAAADGASPLGQASDVQGALRLALTLLPEAELARIVLATDGLETRGSLLAELETARRFGVPVHYLDLTDVPRPSELMVTGLELPEDLQPNVPFTARGKVVSEGRPEGLAATCELLIDGVEAKTLEFVAPPGEHEVELEAMVSQGGEKKVSLVCRARDAEQDRFETNNRFERPVRVPERPKVLYVEGEREYAKNLAAALDRDFEIEYRGARGLPSSLGDAQRFDLIFVSDVPRAGEMGYENMTTGQMRVLEGYVRAGGGLIFAGGENSFGPGGYTDTYLERQVLPVRLEVERKEDMPGVALMLVIDRSGSMTGPKLELAKQAAIATLGVLQPSDKLGVVVFDSKPEELVKLQRASNRYKITDSLSRLRPGGGTNVFAALDFAYGELVRTQAKVKHIILLTDGQSNRAGILELVAGSAEDKVTISTVAVGMGSDQELLRQIAEDGHGRYYFTNSPQNIPKLFLKETSEVTRRALVEDRFRPRVDPRYRHLQMFKGLDMNQAPSLVGYVSTRAKPRAEVLMTSHLGEPLMARWRLGLGTVLVWTSDVKNRWAHFWLGWPGYAKFWRQVLRDTLRVEKEDPSYAMFADVAEGVLTVGVDAVGDDDRFISGVTSRVTVRDPSGREHAVALAQTAAGRYEGQLAVSEFGPYVIRGEHVPTQAAAAGGAAAEAPRAEPDPEGQSYQSFATVVWPFPEEYRGGEPDLTAVAALAEATGGLRDPSVAQLFDVGGAATERRTSHWPEPLYLALGLLVLDVLLRRVRLYGKTRLGWHDVHRAR